MIEDQNANSPLRSKKAANYKLDMNSKIEVSPLKSDPSTLSKQLLNFKQYMVNLPSLQHLMPNHPFAKPQNAGFGNFKYRSWFEMVFSLQAIPIPTNKKTLFITKNTNAPQISSTLNVG